MSRAFLGILAVAGVLALGIATVGRAQQDRARVYGEARSSPARTVQVDIRVDSAIPVAGFSFILSFDPAIIHFSKIDKGSFLTSSGRRMLCTDPTIDVSAVRIYCATLGTKPAAATGDGVLATVTFLPRTNGNAQLQLSHVDLVGIDGSEVPLHIDRPALSVEAGDASGGGLLSSWPFRIAAGALAAAIAIGAAALAALSVRRRSRGVHSDSPAQ